MKLFCAGFNLYGQFRNIDEKCIESFKATIYDKAHDIQISHSFIIITIDEGNYLHEIHKTEINKKFIFHGFSNRKPCQIKELTFDNDNIIQVSMSDASALFLSSNNKIWSFASNINTLDYELLALSDFTKTEQSEQELDDHIIKVACGSVIRCAYSKNGIFYSIPTKLESKLFNVKDIVCGREHCLILTEDGLVYSFGGGSRGQLGHGNVENESEPRLIETLCGIKITKIACGSWHSMAISLQGDLYSWGWNSNGQLGLNTNTDEHLETESVSVMASPHVINFDLNVVDVACGSRHTIVLLDNLQLFGSGWNKYCQLGFKSNTENFYKMMFLYDFKNMIVRGLRCGPWNSAVLVE